MVYVNLFQMKYNIIIGVYRFILYYASIIKKNYNIQFLPIQLTVSGKSESKYTYINIFIIYIIDDLNINRYTRFRI